MQLEYSTLGPSLNTIPSNCKIKAKYYHLHRNITNTTISAGFNNLNYLQRGGK